MHRYVELNYFDYELNFFRNYMFPFGKNNEVCILIYSVTRKVITCISWVNLRFAVDLNIFCK